jgi:hypothetical protein
MLFTLYGYIFLERERLGVTEDTRFVILGDTNADAPCIDFAKERDGVSPTANIRLVPPIQA